MSIDANSLIKRYNALKEVRDGYWSNVWREVREYVMPTYSDYLTEGGARGQNLFDTTAVKARARLAAGIYNWLCPPTMRWFELTSENEDLARQPEVKDWFADVTQMVAMAMANSNWPSVLTQVLNNLACGLDGIVYVEEGDRKPLNFRSFPVETVCYSLNWYGQADMVFREIGMSARQIAMKFPDCSPAIAAEAQNPDKAETKHSILHCCFPREDRHPDKLDNLNMPFADVYIDLEGRRVLRESGYEENPFAVCNFERSDNETYGRGPGINLLPDIKMLNRMRQSYIVIMERIADPSWKVPDGSVVSKDFDRSPGSIIIVRPDVANGQTPEPLPVPTSPSNLYNDIKESQADIREGFFLDIFDPLGDLKQITATEAEIRENGKLVPFAPIVGNLHNQLFAPIIHRVFAILARRGELPPVPDALAQESGYRVEFVSKIALSLKKLEAMGWIHTEATLANAAAVRPDIMDNFDLDKVSRDIALSNGTSPKWLVPIADRDKLRAERSQAQAAQMAAEQMAQGAASLGANLNKAPEPGSPLSAVMEGGGI